MNRTLDDHGVFFYCRIGPKVEYQRRVPSLQHLTNLRGRDSGHAQFMEKPLPLPEFIDDEKHCHRNKQGEGTPTDSAHGCKDLIDLAVEKIPEAKQAHSIQCRADSIHEQEPSGANL